MDELWQRYRQFWVPVLYGVGAFLAGLIAVHALTSDPAAGVSQNESKIRTITKFTAPSEKQIRDAKANSALLKEQVDAKSRLLDQRHGDGDDEIEAFVAQAIRAAVARGTMPARADRFEDDPAAAAQATTRAQQLIKDSVDRLRQQDPNVAFSRLRADVVGELAIRANRADVDVNASAEEFGLSSIATVDRAELPRRLANLALIATVLDVAIREGVRSIDAVAILSTDSTLTAAANEGFLAQWPVKIEMTGRLEDLTAILNTLTDPARPTPLGSSSLKLASASKKDGTVRADLRLYSTRVRPDEPLGLETEGGE